MNFQKIPGTELNISPLTLGTWVFGGLSWSGSDDRASQEAILTALDSGINCIDTAPIYSRGDSERIIGKALGSRRKHMILATKCGLVRQQNGEIGHNLSASNIRDEVEGSLRRLKTDYIDLYQCHAPDSDTPLKETMTTLLALQKEGKIRYFGVSNFSLDLIQEAKKHGPVVTAQDHYSLLVKKIEEELKPYCCKNGVGILAYGPLAGGILSGKYLKPPELKGMDARSFFYKFYEGDAFKKTQKLLKRLGAFKRPLNQLALNWVRQQAGVTSVLVGCRNSAQVQDNVQALQWDLTPDELNEIDDLTRGFCDD